MLRFKSQAAVGILLLVLISCTIIKDSDITSRSQLDALTLTSFEIVQNSLAGNSSVLATLLYDSSVNRISSGTGAHVKKVKGFSLPALGKYKMTLKSGTNAQTDIVIGYRDNGTPNAFVIYKGDSVVEMYKFYYNSSNQLVKLVANINPVDDKPMLLHIKDTLIYPTGPSNYPSSIIRNSSDATLAGTYTVCQSCGSGSSSSQIINMITFDQSNQVYQINFNSGNHCDSNNYYPYPCGGVTKSNNTGGGGSNGNQNQLSFQNSFTFDKTIQTFLTSESNTDTYYFHPIMLLKDVVPQGSFYFWFYSVDWFNTTGVISNNSDMVKINFNYGH